MFEREEVERLKALRLAAWRKRFGTKPATGHGCARRLLPRSKSTTALLATLQLPKNCDWGCLRPPWGDHGDLWRRNGAIAVYTTQPYNWNAEKEREVTAWCTGLGLSVAFSDDESWHHPGGTTLITIWHPTNPLLPQGFTAVGNRRDERPEPLWSHYRSSSLMRA